jgi:hypothetical protein
VIEFWNNRQQAERARFGSERISLFKLYISRISQKMDSSQSLSEFSEIKITRKKKLKAECKIGPIGKVRKFRPDDKMENKSDIAGEKHLLGSILLS